MLILFKIRYKFFYFKKLKTKTTPEIPGLIATCHDSLQRGIGLPLLPKLTDHRQLLYDHSHSSCLSHTTPAASISG